MRSRAGAGPCGARPTTAPTTLEGRVGCVCVPAEYRTKSPGILKAMVLAHAVPIATFQLTENQVEKTVRAPNTRNARWMPRISSGALEWKRSGIKNAVTSGADATPKLIDICCMVLAMVLALLVSSTLTSA